MGPINQKVSLHEWIALGAIQSILKTTFTEPQIAEASDQWRFVIFQIKPIEIGSLRNGTRE